MSFKFIFIIIAFIAAVSSQCLNNGILWQSDCYYFQTSNIGFANAEQACNEIGGSLASIHNSFTNAFVAQKASLTFNNATVTDFWIGGTTMLNIGHWSWTDGTKFDFNELWDHRMSNDSICIGMRMKDGVWNQQNCYQQRNFVCKLLSTPPTTTQPCKNGI
uniref:C-type lectin domain-containing protein n=1 Tax=Panagrolaimus sp. PS1159 TaxID=55785 RepID=A0AC35FTL8_9BILA